MVIGHTFRGSRGEQFGKSVNGCCIAVVAVWIEPGGKQGNGRHHATILEWTTFARPEST